MNHSITGTLLFQGDSITDAFRRPEELNDTYRMGNGYAFIIASLLRAISGQASLSIQNRGVSGHNVGNLLFRWQRDCLELRPDTLSLLIGINNVNQAVHAKTDALPEFASDFDALLAQTKATLPACRIILIEPFALPVGINGAAYMQQIAPIQAHVRAAATRIGATLVPTQDVFNAVAGNHPERWIYDGIHPTAAGQWILAQRWLDIVTGIKLPAPQAMAH